MVEPVCKALERFGKLRCEPFYVSVLLNSTLDIFYPQG